MSSIKMLFLLVAVVFNSSTSKGNEFTRPLNLNGGDLSQHPFKIQSNPPEINKTSTSEEPPAVANTATDTNSSGASADASGAIAGSAQNAKIVAANGPTGLESLAGLCAGLSSPIGQTLKPFCVSLQESAIACAGKYATTSSTCNTETSPSLLTSVSQIQGLMGVAQGITNSCSVFSKAMNIAKLGMAAYTTTCGVLQKACDISCSKSSAELTKFQAETTALQTKLTACANNTTNPALASLCREDLAFLQGNIDPLVKKELAPAGTTVVAKASVCKIDVASLLGMSIINLGALAQSKAMSDQCKKDTTAQTTPVDCTKDENKEKTECKAASTVVDCGLTANADKPVCICKANPRLKGCEGISTSFATNSTLSTGGSGSASGKGLSSGINNGTDSAINKQFPSDLAKTNKNDGTSSGFGSGGGSSAGLAGSSDGSASGNEAQIAKNNLANANILGGDSGGGGGGGYRFNMGSSSAARNLARNIAATGAKGKLAAMDWSNQVTSNAGKSNFDKIKVRYNENRTSLLNK